MRAIHPWSGQGPSGPTAHLRGTVHGIRRWTLVPGADGEIRLGSVGLQEQWLNGGKTTWARCRRGSEQHPSDQLAPFGSCSCGLHALHPAAADAAARLFAPADTTRHVEIVGIVEAWGTVHVHREGFRAQYARPAALLLIGADRDSDYGRLLTDLAIAHRARVVELEGPASIAPWCSEAGVGLSPEQIDELVAGR